MKTYNELFEEIISRNEGGPAVALKFSDPDGVRSGKSGWSFGDCQFDTQNNPLALQCLRECGFTEDEIQGVVKQSIDVKPLEANLRAHADIIRKYDMAQLQHCLDSAGQWCEKYGIAIDSTHPEAFLMFADTVNQFGSLGGGSAAHIENLGHSATAKDILDMKLTWKYARDSKEKHDDTIRRYNNVLAVVAENAKNND